MPLTDIAIRNSKPSRKVVKLSDGGGLFLLIQPHGTKLWRLAYRFGGKQKLLAFGIYPTVSLADARARRDNAKKFLADGVDPSVQRKLEKQASVITFQLVAEELVDKMQREGRAAATLAKTRWLLEFAYTEDIGERPIAKVSALELLAVLRKIEARGNYETARRLRSTCGMVFRYARNGQCEMFWISVLLAAELDCPGSGPDYEFEFGFKAVDTFKLLKTLVDFVPRL